VAIPLFLINLGLLILVLIPGIGVKVLGARRWISLGSYYFQPSEMMKLSLTLFLAKYISTRPASLKYFLPLVLVAGLIMLEPDLGTTLVISLAAMAQIFISAINLSQFFLVSLVGLAATIGLILISPYRKERLLSFLQQTQDPLGRSYHIRQILLALGSGGIFGVGLGQSRQKFLFLPESATDSIFAVIAEEVGFFGAIALVSLFAFFIFRCFRITRKAPDDFGRILGIGLTTWLGGQIFLNIGSMVALFPITGIPLPFISYGGSSLVTVLLACGILLNISKYALASKNR
jgi:cell division protein FtsW